MVKILKIDLARAKMNISKMNNKYIRWEGSMNYWPLKISFIVERE